MTDLLGQEFQVILISRLMSKIALCFVQLFSRGISLTKVLYLFPMMTSKHIYAYQKTHIAPYILFTVHTYTSNINTISSEQAKCDKGPMCLRFMRSFTFYMYMLVNGLVWNLSYVYIVQVYMFIERHILLRQDPVLPKMLFCLLCNVHNNISF